MLRRVTHDFESRWHFNSATALLMELVNEIQAQEPLEEGVRPEVAREVFELLTLMLAPMVPHLAEELWEILGPHAGHAGACAVAKVCAGTGRGRSGGNCGASERPREGQEFPSKPDSDKEELAERVLADPKIAKLLDGQRVVKRIVVPDKLVNVVVG